MHRTAALTTLLGLAASLAPLPSCLGGSCEGIPLAAVDYDDDASWLCLPDREDICSAERHIYEALPSGAVVERFEGPAEDPPIDCFYVYPTVDLRPRLGVQEDLTALDRPRKAAATQFAAFSAACRPFAPVYRQVSIGTYLYGERRSDPCFEVAYSDVLAAFERYLERDNDGRGFALVGHSQGGQHVSRLIHERIEG
ncbi:MAG: DUF3089 domain-containing protein, partial [Solirubrobacterales bacterium]|nr:DUF3089 domain-containing protein [Solirubrobacterales bacterium]